MKKFIVLLISLFSSFILLCVPSYASGPETVNFNDYFLPFDLILVGNDKYYNDEGYDPETGVYQASPYPGDTLNYSSSHLRVKLKQSYLKSGTRIMFDMKVDMVFNDYLPSVDRIWPKLYFKTVDGWQKVGWTEVISDASQGLYTESVIYHVDYVIPMDVVDPVFTFDWISDPTRLVQFNYVSYSFPEKVSNFYIGDGNDPSFPNYVDPNDYVGNSVDDYKQQEEAILGETEEGRDSTISLFSGLGDLVDLVAIPIMAISAAVSYFIDGSIVNSILLISLALGLLSFVFNIVPSYQAKQRRDAAEERRQQYQQYKKGGGG